MTAAVLIISYLVMLYAVTNAIVPPLPGYIALGILLTTSATLLLRKNR